jgi:hypothetical protein
LEFPFVQFEFTHAIGPTQGRYVVLPESAAPRVLDELDLLPPHETAALAAPEPAEPPGSAPSLSEHVAGVYRGLASADVIVMAVVGASAARRRSLMLRRGPAVTGGEPPADVALQLATVIRATRSLRDGRAAKAWLEELREDPAKEEEFIDSALMVLCRAVRGYRIGAGDPYVADVTRADARAIRVGFGDGKEVADGRWRAAYLVLAPTERLSRADRIKPAEIVAGVLNHRAPVFDADELLLRGVLDLDQARPRAAAFQLRAMLELVGEELAQRGYAAGVQERLERVEVHGPRLRELCNRSFAVTLGEKEVGFLVEVAEEAGALLNAVRSHALSTMPPSALEEARPDGGLR